MTISREVPAHHIDAFREKRTRYCLIIPVLNEGERIAAELERLQPLSAVADIVIADGGSSDGSVTPEKLKTKNVRTLLVKTGPGRLSAQMRMGIAYALQEGYEGTVFIDGNNKDDPSALPAFVAALDEGFDHIQGSRYIAGGRAVNTPWMRHWAVQWLHAPLISVAAGFRYTDTTNGFRAYSRRLLTDPRVDPLRDCFQRYELHYYLAIRAAKLGFKVKELPVTRVYPARETPSKIKGWKGNWEILATLCKAAAGGWAPHD